MSLKTVTMPNAGKDTEEHDNSTLLGVNEMLQLLCKIVWQQKNSKKTFKKTCN